MDLETGKIIPLVDGEEVPEGYYPMPADISQLFAQLPEQKLQDYDEIVATRNALQQKREELELLLAKEGV